MARKIALAVMIVLALALTAAAEAEDIEAEKESPWPENAVPGQFLVPVTQTVSLFARFTADDSFCTMWQCYIVTDEETAKWHEASGLAPYYEPVVLYQLMATRTTISPSDQWALNATGWNDAFFVGGSRMTTVPNANDATAQTPVIAIIDTGMRESHEALQQAHYTTEYNTHGYVFDNATGFENTREIFDNETHGTHIAGIIGGPADNIGDTRLGGSGMGKVRVLPFNAAIPDRSAPKGVSIRSDATLKAIDKICRLKLDTIAPVPIVAVNMSYGQSAFLQSEFNAIKALHDAGIIAVVAAGNESADLSRTAVYPANYDLGNIITVAAVGSVGSGSNLSTRFASYSNYGGATGIAAPGTNMLSSVNEGDNTYDAETGTSMSTPFVAGALGAAYALYNDMNGEPPTAQQLINFLYESARYNSSLVNRTLYGEIDLEALIQYVYDCTAESCNFTTYPERPKFTGQTTTSGGGSGNADLFGCGCSLTGGKAKFNFFELAFAVMIFGAYKLHMRRRYSN